MEIRLRQVLFVNFYNIKRISLSPTPHLRFGWITGSLKYVLFRCYHVIEAEKAIDMADEVSINLDCLIELKDEVKNEMREYLKSDTILIKKLPGRNLCLPRFGREDDLIPYVHLMNGKVTRAR